MPAIANDFHRAYNEYKGIGFASVISAVPLDQELRSQIETIAKKLSAQNKTELAEKVDPALIGGFVLIVGDKQIDASVSSKLRALKLKFSYNPYKKEF